MNIIVDKDIPFIKGRLEAVADVVYCKGNEIDGSIVKDADAMIIRTRTRCDENLLEGSKVRFISTATIGTDHIDIDWCETKVIKVASAQGCNAPGVAQYIFSAIFQLGFDPKKDTLGIIGYGNVGSTVGRWAEIMGIRTIVYDPFKQKLGNETAKFSELDVLLRNSDAVTLHVPLTTTGLYPTLGMIGNKEIEMLKPSTILVNSSRGGVVKEEDLKQGIMERKIRAVIDTWKNEPDIDRELLSLSSIGTPHIAGYSYEGKLRGTRMALQAVADNLGIIPDMSGLECNQLIPENQISPDLILKSYNPIHDSIKLKEIPSDFEKIRNNYDYRHEPLFIKL